MEPEIPNAAQFPSNSMHDSNSTIPTLPPELISEILLRLPVNSLLKFRFVSITWLALNSSPKFVKTHLSLCADDENKENTHHVLFRDIGEEKSNFMECPIKSLLDSSMTEALELDFPIEIESHQLGARGSCNGLIYLAHHFVEHSLLWNPTTREHKNLPLFRPRAKKCTNTCGFGYDELHDDYKAVIITYNHIIRSSDDIEVKVYSLKSDSWTTVDYCDETFSSKKSVGYCGDRLVHHGAFVGGKLHWGTYISNPSRVEYLGKNIISFDLANEKWEKVDKPPYEQGETELVVGKLGSDLSVFCDYKRTHLSAWVMKDYGIKESWIKMFAIRYPDDLQWFSIFFRLNKGEILSLYGPTSVIYNPRDDS